LSRGILSVLRDRYFFPVMSQQDVILAHSIACNYHNVSLCLIEVVPRLYIIYKRGTSDYPMIPLISNMQTVPHIAK